MIDDKLMNQPEPCSVSLHRFGQNLMYFVIGGSIGAGIALLVAPKRGSELRADIADVAAKRYDETLVAARELKRTTAEYYDAAKETGNEVLDVVVEGAVLLKQEIAKDVEKLGKIVDGSAKRAATSSSQSA